MKLQDKIELHAVHTDGIAVTNTEVLHFFIDARLPQNLFEIIEGFSVVKIDGPQRLYSQSPSTI